ncbi:APOB1 complementation factor [Bulinus truncatus]|nr:APOB1 complementation factor [Bulinus truncatus]
MLGQASLRIQFIPTTDLPDDTASDGWSATGNQSLLRLPGRSHRLLNIHQLRGLNSYSMILNLMFDNFTYCKSSAPFVSVDVKFIPDSRNPCWWDAGVLRCVPYFYIAGFSKSGTTDLYARLLQHQLLAGTMKEKHWFDFNRFIDGLGRLSCRVCVLVCLSVDNCRLFRGRHPENEGLRRGHSRLEMSKITEGVVDVIVYPSAMDKSKNRGFAFVEYEKSPGRGHGEKKLIPGRVQLWEARGIAADWAEPEPEPMKMSCPRQKKLLTFSCVRILYVRNLMLSTTEEHLQQIFERLIEKKDCIERVKKLRDYAFIHFKLREDAIKALEASQDGFEIDGAIVEVVLAKPVDKNDYNKVVKSKIAGIESENPLMSSLYAPVVNQVDRTLQPTVAVRGGRGRGAAGSRGAGGSRSYLPALMRGSYRRNPVEVLEEMCQKNHWGLPVYQLHSAIQRETTTNTDSQFFLFKVTIPALASQTIQPNKLCRTVEEAKVFAAEFALLHLGIPIESSEIPIVPSSSSTYHRTLHGSMSLSQGPLTAPTSYIVGLY